MSKEHHIKIGDGGEVVMLHDDDFIEVLDAVGDRKVTRASHVEPNERGKFEADMTPSGGPASLGEFEKRQDALDTEVAWLNEHVFKGGAGPVEDIPNSGSMSHPFSATPNNGPCSSCGKPRSHRVHRGWRGDE